MSDTEIEDFKVDVCKKCLRALGGYFFDSKRTFFRNCSLCKRMEQTQNFKLKFVDEFPPKENEDNQ